MLFGYGTKVTPNILVVVTGSEHPNTINIKGFSDVNYTLKQKD